MDSSKLLFICCSIAAVSVAAATDTLSDSDKTAVVSMHNTERASMGATFMSVMRWNDDLAAGAATWLEELANDCPSIEHPKDNRDLVDVATYGNQMYNSMDRSDGRKYNPSAGQNLAYSSYNSPMTNEEALSLAFNLWIDEKNGWTWGTGRDTSIPGIDSNYAVGHFTQVVWDTTSEVGCAVKRCSGNGADNVIIACNYFPAGNGPRDSNMHSVNGGSNQAYPYQEGTAGSECSTRGSGDADIDGLCKPQCYGWAAAELYDFNSCDTYGFACGFYQPFQCGCTVMCSNHADTPEDMRFCKNGEESPVRGAGHICPADD